MNERATLYTCDRCKCKEVGRSGGGYEDDRAPLDWSVVTYANPSASTSKDLCGQCSNLWREIFKQFMAQL